MVECRGFLGDEIEFKRAVSLPLSVAALAQLLKPGPRTASLPRIEEAGLTPHWNPLSQIGIPEGELNAADRTVGND